MIKVKGPKLRFKEFDCKYSNGKLQDISSIRTGPFGSVLHRNDYVESGTPIITVEHLDDLGIRHINLPRVSDTDKKRLCSYLLKTGDLVFSRVGSVDRSSMISDREDGWLFSGRLLRIRTDENVINSKYLCYYFQLDHTKYRIRSVAVGQTMPSLNTEILNSFKVEYSTNIREQEKIASFLSAVDAKIQQLTKKKELLEQYKKGVMHKIFKQEIRFKDEEGKSYPKWEQKKLGDVLDLTLRQVIKPSDPYLAIGIRSHGKGTFQKPNSDPKSNVMEKLFEVKGNDLIVNITFAWEGAIAIAQKEDEGGLVSHRFPTYTFKKGIATHRFFRYVIIQNRFKLLLDLISPGGAGRNRVMSKPDFLNLKYLIPSYQEQNRIADFLEGLDKKINSVGCQLDKTKQFKKGLLQQMFV